MFAPADAATRADPWFVRVADYPGVGSQLAGHAPVVLAPGAALTRGLRTLVADGVLDDAAAACWAADVESHGSVGAQQIRDSRRPQAPIGRITRWSPAPSARSSDPGSRSTAVAPPARSRRPH